MTGSRILGEAVRPTLPTRFSPARLAEQTPLHTMVGGGVGYGSAYAAGFLGASPTVMAVSGGVAGLLFGGGLAAAVLKDAFVDPGVVSKSARGVQKELARAEKNLARLNELPHRAPRQAVEDWSSLTSVTPATPEEELAAARYTVAEKQLELATTQLHELTKVLDTLDPAIRGEGVKLPWHQRLTTKEKRAEGGWYVLDDRLHKYQKLAKSLRRGLDKLQFDKDDPRALLSPNVEASRHLLTEVESRVAALSLLVDARRSEPKFLDHRLKAVDKIEAQIREDKIAYPRGLGVPNHRRLEVGLRGLSSELASHERAVAKALDEVKALLSDEAVPNGNLPATRSSLEQLQERIRTLSADIDERLRGHWTDDQDRGAEQLRRLSASSDKREGTLSSLSEAVLSAPSAGGEGQRLLKRLETELTAVGSEWKDLTTVVVDGRNGEDPILRAEKDLMKDLLHQQARKLIQLQFSLRAQVDGTRAVEWANREIALKQLPEGLAAKLRGPV